MGARMRAFDWGSTPLGPADTWPQSLKTTVRIVLTSRFAMWMAWGPDLTFFCNDAYLPTTGVKQDWVLGARSDQVWAEIWPDIGPLIDRVLTTGEATWDEQLLLYLERRGFSEETYHTFSYSPLADDQGRTAGMLCVVAEVTERVIGERQLAALRDLAARLSAASTRPEVTAAFEASLAADPTDLPFALVYLTEPDGGQAQLVSAHNLARDHRLAAARIRIEDPAATWPLGAALAEGLLAVAEVEAPLDGLHIRRWQAAPHNAWIAPIGATEGAQPLGYLVAGLNPHRPPDDDYRGFIELLTGQLAAAISRADEFEHERARAEALAELDRAKTAFFSNVSHEFRTPLTLMLGPLEDALADAASLPERQAGRIDTAHRNGLRLLRLVNTLLDFSRIESGRIEASFRPVDLSALTIELASTFRSAFARAGLSFEVDCPPLPEPVQVDRDMWEKIVLNLLSNAFKFTLSGGATLRLTGREGLAVLEVSDTGVGVPEHELPRLFERFHRVEGAAGRSFEGSGIGLALVDELVKLHGGTISATSRLGVGTTFRVELPLDGAHPPQTRIAAASAAASTSLRAEAFVDEALRWLPAPANPVQAATSDAQTASNDDARRQGRILLADDNADLRDYVRGLLEGRGYAVETAVDGQAALDSVRRRRPDLLLTDVMMPRLDGLGLLAAVRGDPALADLPVVMLSARAGEEAQVEGLDAGADDYLAKPFSARELLARVSANLEMARVRRETAEALRESEARLAVERERLATVLAKAPIGIAITDAQGAMTMLNERGAELIGTRHQPSGPQDFGVYGGFHPDGRPIAPDDYAMVRALRGERVERARMVYQRPAEAGGRIVLEADAVPIHDADGRLAGAVAVFDDADARDREEQALRRKVAEAVAAREAALAQLHEVAKLETLGQLTGGVAHDFNNLLTPIMGSLDMLRRRVDDERAQKHIAIALQAAERSRTLIQRLLAFARRQNLEARPVAVDALLEGMRDLIQRTLGSDIRLAVDTAADLPPVQIDPNQLELAILNLCVNAHDAMPDGGTLTLSARAETLDPEAAQALSATLAPGPYVRLDVTDTGAGMDQATLARAIEPFFTTKGQGRGTGLGLSMVHGLAAQSGGRFRLDSRPGAGTRATLWLPLARDAVRAPGAQALHSSTRAAPARVLLVDDEEIVRRVAAEMLEDLGYTVVEAGSSSEALRLVSAAPPVDIVVTDFQMPGGNGVELAKAVREIDPKLPVLLITGFAQDKAEATEDRTLPRLAKPFRQAEIADRVAALLGRG
jgi:PAS domain S-box-containing protein